MSNKKSDPIASASRVERLVHAIEDPRLRSWAPTGLLILGLLAALYVARVLLLPVVMALVLTLVFAPFVRRLKAARIPESLGAALVVLGVIATAGIGTYHLAEPASDWLVKAPESVRAIRAKLQLITEPVRIVNTAGEQFAATTEDISGRDDHDEELREVTVRPKTWAGKVFDAMQTFVVSAIGMLVLLYFLLASGDMFLGKVIAATPRLAEKERATSLAREIESEVSAYLFTVIVINTLLGCAVALAMYFMGVPNPVLWGVMAGLLNFIPYLGDIASLSVLTVVGLLTFDGLWPGLLVPAVFCLITAAEGYVITPLVVGRRLSVNPVVVVLSVLFWGWMWGIVGAILAVPILVVLKSICTHVERLKPFGDFLEA